MNDTDVLRINAPTVIHESIDGEVVIVNLDTGGYFGLNPTANVVWRLINGRHSVGEVLGRMRSSYGAHSQDIDEQVRCFLVSLGENSLVVSGPAEGGPDAQAPSETEPELSVAYGAPELLAYTDMQELLLLDPIHEVDEGGWPNPKSEPPDGQG